MTVWLTREVWCKSYTLLGPLWLIPTGSDQATDDGCAVWSASVRRFGFVSGGCSGITTSCKQQSCQCLGRPTSHFLCWSQGAARRTWHTSPLTRAEAATITTTTTTTTVLECKKLLKTWFLQWCDPACVVCRDRLIWKLQRKLQTTWKQNTMNSHSLFRYKTLELINGSSFLLLLLQQQQQIQLRLNQKFSARLIDHRE
jgi:hypothetical protein